MSGTSPDPEGPERPRSYRRSKGYVPASGTGLYLPWQGNPQDLLTELEKLGIKADMVQLVDSTVEFSRYRNDEKSEAERTISMNFKYDTAMINTILDLLNHGQYTYEFDVTYSYSKQAELKASLLQAAIENAKKQAESICESLGTKILGIEEVQSDEDLFFMDKTKDFAFREALRCGRPSDLLGNPLIKASKEVVIKWITG